LSGPPATKRYYTTETTTRKLVMGVARLVLPLFYRLEAQHPERLPREGGCILAANHLNIVDPFPIQIFAGRPIFFMAKAELHSTPWMDAFMRRLGSFPVSRGERDQWALNHAAALLNGGQVLGMFPEGTRSHGRGLAPAKGGVARLALNHGCQIVPVGLAGVQDRIGLTHRRVISIRFGQPIEPRSGEEPTELTDRMMYTIAALLPPDLRGAYRVAPPGFPELHRILEGGVGPAGR
jgi:1-acyl-sn-glycerol-3-phosphate acyltransferase